MWLNSITLVHGKGKARSQVQMESLSKWLMLHFSVNIFSWFFIFRITYVQYANEMILYARYNHTYRDISIVEKVKQENVHLTLITHSLMVKSVSCVIQSNMAAMFYIFQRGVDLIKDWRLGFLVTFKIPSFFVLHSVRLCQVVA